MLTIRMIPIIICLIGSLVSAENMQGHCVGVTDGDTATVKVSEDLQIKVRLECIDAPERNQDYGQVAKQKLSDLILDKDIDLDISTTDKYGRRIAKVYVEGTNANLEMVRSGLAWHYAKFSPDAIDFSRAEKEAREQKIGLWSQPNPTPPWDWRKGITANNNTSSAKGIEKQADTTSTKTENTMITTIASGDVNMSKWLEYALRTMVDNLVFPLVIIVVGTVLFTLLIGWLWGKIWNKEWNLEGARLLGVLLLSFIAAFSLAGVHRMYGGSFDSSVASIMKSLPGLTHGELKEEAAKVLPMILKIQEFSIDAEDAPPAPKEGEIVISLDENFVSSYLAALTVWWSLFGGSLLLLAGGVGWYAYKDIEVIKPYDTL